MPSTDSCQSDSKSPTITGHVLRQTLVSVGPSLAVYYGARAAGVSVINALIAATLVSAAQVLVSVIRNRKIDLISGFLVLNFGLSLIIALVTSDARATQVTNTIPGILIALFFAASALVGKPLTELMVGKTRPGHVEQLMAEQNWTADDVRAYHRMHVHLSFWSGVLGLAFAAISITIIYSFSVDVAQAVNQVFSIVTTLGLVIGIIMVIRRYLGRRAPATGSP